MTQEYAEARYQVEMVMYDNIMHTTSTTVYYTDDFFDAARVGHENILKFHHLEIFDSAMGRTLFNSADLD